MLADIVDQPWKSSQTGSSIQQLDRFWFGLSDFPCKNMRVLTIYNY